MKIPAVTKAGSLKFDGRTGAVHIKGWTFDYMRQPHESKQEAARVGVLAAIDYMRGVVSEILPDEIDDKKFWMKTSQRSDGPSKADDGGSTDG